MFLPRKSEKSTLADPGALEHPTLGLSTEESNKWGAESLA